jgi:hypothetical protein
LAVERRIGVVWLGGLLAAAAPLAAANTFTGVEMREGVRVELQWHSSTGAWVSLPFAENEPLPYGDHRLRIEIPQTFLTADPADSVLRVRRGRESVTLHGVATSATAGGLSFTVPLHQVRDFEFDLEATLVTLRRPIGVESLRVLSLAYLPAAQHYEVISVERHVDLAWDGCPAPCGRRPSGLDDVTPGEWRRALEVVEVDRQGNRTSISEFDAGLDSSRPASIVFLVDASGSVLQEDAAEALPWMLGFFERFAEAAYADERAGEPDRLALLYFDREILGYYAGTGLAAERRFFRPAELAASWERLCAGADDPSSTAARLDDGWLVGLAVALERAGYAGLETASRPARRRVCEDGLSPRDVLELHRGEVRACNRGAACPIRPAETDVLQPLRRAVVDLDLLRLENSDPDSTADNQPVVVLLSDGLDAPFMRADDRQRADRLRRMEELLEGKRFVFVDVHSDLVLSKMILDALAHEHPLYRTVARGIEQHVEDPELSLVLRNLIALPDDAELQRRARAALAGGALEGVEAESPVLADLLRRVVRDGEALPAAFRSAEARLAAHGGDGWLRGTERERWRSAVRGAPDAANVRRNLAQLEQHTIGQFRRLADATGGRFVSAAACARGRTDAGTDSATDCVVGEVLDALRGTLLVQYQPRQAPTRGEVEVRLTPYGRELLEARGLRQATVAAVSAR